MPVLSRPLDAGRSDVRRLRTPPPRGRRRTAAGAAQLRPSTGRHRRWSVFGRPESRPRTAPAGARPASDPSPTDPVLRANPFPEVTDPICRLPLPTLFYRLEAVHLGDLLRISVRSGTRITPSPPDFQGPTRAHRTPREARCFTGTTALSPAKPIPGRPSLTKKRELFPGPAPTSPVSFALPHWTRHEDAPISVLGFGNISPIPFRR